MSITEEIKRIKYLRMKPEERFLYDILSNIKFGYDINYPYSIFLTLNNKILFEYNSKIKQFNVDFNDVWSVLLEKYNMDNHDIQILIKNMTWNMLKLNVHITKRKALITPLNGSYKLRYDI